MTTAGADFTPVDGVPTAWFTAPSLTAGAELAARVGERAAVDLRTTGVRVRLAADEDAAAVSRAARELGLTADPTGLQQVGVVVETGDPAAVGAFWSGVLDVPDDGGRLTDPLGRDPALVLRLSTDRRPLRNRLHLDVVRPATVVDRLGLGAGGGPYGVRHADPDGNEVDLVPGGPLGESPGTADWQAVFSAVACYRTTSPGQQQEVAAAAAAIADEAGFPLLVDLRPGWVVLDSGKDQWEADAHGLDMDFAELAARLQSAAHDLGATADPALPRFVQLFLDAADVDAVRAFWIAALGATPDRRGGATTDVHDPRRLSPVLVFQQLDTDDAPRRAQRDRLHVELSVPADQARGRVATAVAAGGRVADGTDGRWLVTDPEGNELVVLAG